MSLHVEAMRAKHSDRSLVVQLELGKPICMRCHTHPYTHCLFDAGIELPCDKFEAVVPWETLLFFVDAFIKQHVMSFQSLGIHCIHHLATFCHDHLEYVMDHMGMSNMYERGWFHNKVCELRNDPDRLREISEELCLIAHDVMDEIRAKYPDKRIIFESMHDYFDNMKNVPKVVKFRRRVAKSRARKLDFGDSPDKSAVTSVKRGIHRLRPAHVSFKHTPVKSLVLKKLHE